MRPNYFFLVHKGIRKRLFDFINSLAAVDASHPSDGLRLKDSFLDLTRLLKTHSDQEDKFINPFIARHLTEDATHLDREHQKLDRMQGQLVLLFNQLTKVRESSNEFELDFFDFYNELNIFVAHYLNHLIHEEKVMPKIWDKLSDDEILIPYRELILSLSLEEVKETLVLMLPAITQKERAEILGTFSTIYPPEAWEQVLQTAQSVLDGDEWGQLAAVLVRARVG